MGRFFGTDGVRGVANSELTPELAFKLGMAATRYFTEKNNKATTILIGMDTRRSGDMLEAALVAGITCAGGDACCVGIVPTPGVAYLAKKYGMDGGAVISASHNPFLDNGIKFFDGNGYKLDDEAENTIELLLESSVDSPRPVGGKVGVRLEAQDGLDDYVEYLKTTLDDLDFEGIKITLDCANGAAYQAAPSLFYDLKASLNVIADEPDGENINLRCGSTHMEQLTAAVIENGSDLGIAFDGDSDRCLAVDDKGRMVDGDCILSILGSELKKRGELWKDTIVSTVMSNMGLSELCREKGINLEETGVGDKYVLMRMLEKGYMLGGEQSGHIINLKYGTTGDGLLTAIQLVKIVKETGKKLSELACVMEVYPQVLINARVSNERKKDYLTSTEISNAIKIVEEKYAGRGRVLVRPSGTEPLIRVMIEGKDKEEITNEAKSLAALIEDVLI